MKGSVNTYKQSFVKSAAAAILMTLFIVASNVGAAAVSRSRSPMAVSEINVNGPWRIEQNPGYVGTFTLKQSGSELSGTAEWDVGHRSGVIKGSISGSTIKFTIDYGEGLVGTYEANVEEDGQMVNGTARSNKGGEPVAWSAKRPQGV